MFNFYQNFNKNKVVEGDKPKREEIVTGHDRFCQERPGASSMKKRRATARRTQSAIEFETEPIAPAQDLPSKKRSTSTEDESEEEKFLFTSKIDSLAKIFFSRVHIARGKEQDNNCRNGKHRYTALGSTACDQVIECMELEKRSKDRALVICRAFVQKSSRYSLLQQLKNIGSRVDKHWFLVKDIDLKTERLMTLTPLNENCPFNVCSLTHDVLNNLFLALQHPYICPTLHLEILEYEHNFYVVVIQPLNHASLKDVIYGVEASHWNQDWVHKYVSRSQGLPLPRIQQMGKQILEALVFLKDRGFPTVCHLHSGNVMVQNGVARLAGLENTLLDFTSRAHHSLSFRLARIDALDTILFGHVIFEMCAGYELRSVEPSAEQMSDLASYPQVVKLLESIFDRKRSRRPSIEELLTHDFFRNIDLREMRSVPTTIFRPISATPITSLLEKMKRRNVHERINTSISEQNIMSLESTDVSYNAYSSSSALSRLYQELTNTPI